MSGPSTIFLHIILTKRNPGTLKKKQLWIFLELIPEWKSFTLIGPTLIDCTQTIDEIKKTAEMLAIYNALLQRKPTFHFLDILLSK